MRPCAEAGTSTVELAILAPVFVLLLLGAIWAGDVSLARIRQPSVARYVAWEMTAFALSDEAGSDHAGRFAAARERILAEARERWADLDVVGAGPVGMLGEGKLGALTVDAAPIGSSGRLERPRDGGDLASIASEAAALIGEFAGLQRPVLERFGFNLEHGAVRVSVEAEVGTRLLPLPHGWTGGGSLRLSPETTLLEVDTWALDDGADVPLPGTGTAFGAGVERIALMGLGNRLRRGDAGPVLDWLPIRFGAQVVSQNYLDPARDRSRLRCAGDALADSGRWRNGEEAGTREDEMSPVHCFDTLPMDANGFGPGGGLAGDPMYRLLRSRGNHFMGCDRPQATWPRDCGRGASEWNASR